jgi:hypothetical protein
MSSSSALSIQVGKGKLTADGRRWTPMCKGFGLAVPMETHSGDGKNPGAIISSCTSASIGVHRRFKIAFELVSY